MAYMLYASCLCNTGKVRKNNEDNFFFDGNCLEQENDGLIYPYIMKNRLRKPVRLAVFDGMGGENFGEWASFAAADHMKKMQFSSGGRSASEEEMLADMCTRINEAVIEKQKELCTRRMGSTLVMLSFVKSDVYVCNLGDSRAYRLRGGKLTQLSEDHVEKREGLTSRKAPLTQHLGIRPDDFILEPYIAKSKLESCDWYLLCSDGVTDMLADEEIEALMNSSTSTVECVEKLVNAALAKGGRDNTTAIVCRVI